MSTILTDLTSLPSDVGVCCRVPGVVGRCMLTGRGAISLVAATGGCDVAAGDDSAADVDVSKIGQSLPVSSVPSASIS